MIVGIHHIGVSVPDIRAAIAFYRDAIGMELLFDTHIDGTDVSADQVIGLDRVTSSVAMLRKGAMCVELWEYTHPEPEPIAPEWTPMNHGIPHFCLEVRDIDTEHARLTAAGMRFVGPPVTNGVGRAVYGQDPFGIRIEIFEPSEQSGLRMHRAPEAIPA